MRPSSLSTSTCVAAADRVAPATGPRALVVFEDRLEGWALRLLRPGFRHCFCVLGAGSSWTVCDPLKTRIELIQIHGFSERQFADHFLQTGRTVLIGHVAAGRPRHRIRAISCVEIVKRILNLDAGYAFTPFQLQHALRKRGFIAHGSIDIARK